MTGNLRVAALMAIVGLAVGCTSTKTERVIETERKSTMEELGVMLKSLADEGRKPPARLAELEPVEPMIPMAGPAIRNGDVIYYWGATYSAGGSQVVAYEKKTPTEGGYVLLQDGSVKKMTADEFKTAPQAKK